MNRRRLHYRRAVAIDPISRGFGFAVLEGSHRLVDWGVVHARYDKDRRCITRIDDLLKQYSPNVVVTEEIVMNSRRSARVRRLVKAIQNLAASKRLPYRSISRGRVFRMLSHTGAMTKYAIALAIAQRFPELSPRLPPPRKPWMSEADSMAVFTAVALALTSLV